MEFLALENFGNVQIEEVTVEDGLNTASNDGNDIIEAFKVVSVDPVENVKSTVRSKSKQIMAGDGLSLACN